MHSHNSLPLYGPRLMHSLAKQRPHGKSVFLENQSHAIHPRSVGVLCAISMGNLFARPRLCCTRNGQQLPVCGPKHTCISTLHHFVCTECHTAHQRCDHTARPLLCCCNCYDYESYYMRQYLRFVERLGAQQTHKQHTTIIVNAPFGCFVWVLSTMSTVSTVGASCAIAGSLGPPPMGKLDWECDGSDRQLVSVVCW